MRAALMSLAQPSVELSVGEVPTPPCRFAGPYTIAYDPASGGCIINGPTHTFVTTWCGSCEQVDMYNTIYWYAIDARADFNRDGYVNSQDFFEFMSAFQAQGNP